MSGCGSPSCTCGEGGRPGVLRILWTTFLFEAGRRMVEKAVPSVIIGIPPPRMMKDGGEFNPFVDGFSKRADGVDNPTGADDQKNPVSVGTTPVYA
jgi:hypothetical protein